MLKAVRMRAVSLFTKAIVVAALLAAGAVLYPRPPADVSPSRMIAEVLHANVQSRSAPVDRIRRDLREGCVPILEGSDVIAGKESWPIRLKPPHRRYPWLEVWVDKKTSTILAWKEWGHLNGRVAVLSQFPNP